LPPTQLHTPHNYLNACSKLTAECRSFSTVASQSVSLSGPGCGCCSTAPADVEGGTGCDRSGSRNSSLSILMTAFTHIQMYATRTSQSEQESQGRILQPLKWPEVQIVSHRSPSASSSAIRASSSSSGENEDEGACFSSDGLDAAIISASSSGEGISS
jgi:hypothetical protein